MIKVSIIVPVYNMEKYVRQCLESLCQQKMRDVEFLIINDGSTDNSEKIINEMQKQDRRIKIFNKENGGISSARNYGIKKSLGEYICFVDCDDYIRADYVEKLYKSAVKENADIVVCDYYKKYEDSNKICVENVVQFETTNLLNRKDLLFNINCAPWNKIYKKSLFDNVSFPKYKYEDMAVIPILMYKAKKISKINEPLYYYLIRSNGETGIINNKTQDVIKILDILKKHFKYVDELKDEIEFFIISKTIS